VLLQAAVTSLQPWYVRQQSPLAQRDNPSETLCIAHPIGSCITRLSITASCTSGGGLRSGTNTRSITLSSSVHPCGLMPTQSPAFSVTSASWRGASRLQLANPESALQTLLLNALFDLRQASKHAWRCGLRPILLSGIALQGTQTPCRWTVITIACRSSQQTANARWRLTSVWPMVSFSRRLIAALTTCAASYVCILMPAVRGSTG